MWMGARPVTYSEVHLFASLHAKARRASNERACDLLYADYFEAVADGNTDRQLRLYAQILR